MTPILWLTLTGQFVLFVGTVILLLMWQPLFLIITWAGVSQSLQCLLALFFYQKLNFGKSEYTGLTPASHLGIVANGTAGPGWPVSIAVIKMLIVRAWPFALAGFLAALQLRANILILAYLQGDQALGWYAAANRFVETGKQLPGAFYAAMLPALSAMAGNIEHRENLQKTLRQARLGLLAFGLVASVGALVLARLVLTLTYGALYQPATLTLQILTFTVIPATQNSLLIIYLYARGDEKFVNLLMAVGIAVNLSLCFWLIPLWGPAGTALALLVAESMLYFPYRYRATRQS